MPQKQHLVAARPINHHKYNNYKLIPVTTTTTPLPHDHDAISTQSYQYLQHTYDDISSYDEQPIAATVAPKQHLTETTQIQPPAVSTYNPTAIPPTNHHNHNAYVKIQKIIQSQSTPIPLHEQPIVVNRNPIQIIQNPIENDKIHASVDAQTESEENSQETPLNDVLRKLQASHLLPQILNAENLDDSIQSLVKILNNIKQSQHVAERPPQHHHDIEYDDNVDYNNEGEGNEKRNYMN